MRNRCVGTELDRLQDSVNTLFLLIHWASATSWLQRHLFDNFDSLQTTKARLQFSLNTADFICRLIKASVLSWGGMLLKRCSRWATRHISQANQHEPALFKWSLFSLFQHLLSQQRGCHVRGVSLYVREHFSHNFPPSSLTSQVPHARLRVNCKWRQLAHKHCFPRWGDKKNGGKPVNLLSYQAF